MWLMIDNYDSFSQILLDYLRQLHDDVQCIQNDALSLEEIIALQPERIILSPGPKSPTEAGVSMEVIDYFHDKIPILGVCLGHQALGLYFGAKVQRGVYPIHGKTSVIHHEEKGIFKEMNNALQVMRYHSLVVTDVENTDLDVWAKSEDGCIMAMGHKRFPIVGLQFHPESVLTPQGLEMLHNWKKYFLVLKNTNL